MITINARPANYVVSFGAVSKSEQLVEIHSRLLFPIKFCYRRETVANIEFACHA